MKIEAEKIDFLGKGKTGEVYRYKKDNGDELAIKSVLCESFEEKIDILKEI
jgi:hypothetical protein